MDKIGLFFGSSSGATNYVSSIVASSIGLDKVEIFDVKRSTKEDLLKFDKLILASSTHGNGELQKDFGEFLDKFDEDDFVGKTIALVGVGGQVKHPDTFCSGLKFIKDKVKKANIIGYGLTEYFTFNKSKALENGKFIGLCIDQKSQPELTQGRIDGWIETIKEGFKL